MNGYRYAGGSSPYIRYYVTQNLHNKKWEVWDEECMGSELEEHLLCTFDDFNEAKALAKFLENDWLIQLRS